MTTIAWVVVGVVVACALVPALLRAGERLGGAPGPRVTGRDRLTRLAGAALAGLAFLILLPLYALFELVATTAGALRRHLRHPHPPRPPLHGPHRHGSRP